MCAIRFCVVAYYERLCSRCVLLELSLYEALFIISYCSLVTQHRTESGKSDCNVEVNKSEKHIIQLKGPFSIRRQYCRLVHYRRTRLN